MTEVEREVERVREPEPVIDHYQVMLDYYKKYNTARRKGKVLVKYKDCPWFQSKQALLKYYTSPANMDELASPGWAVFHQRILNHSGKHVHQGGIPIFVLEGKGYSVVDGVRYNWKAGDLIVLPFKPGGVEHQHFNEDPNKPPQWIAYRYFPFADVFANDVKQVETHPDWLGKTRKVDIK